MKVAAIPVSRSEAFFVKSMVLFYLFSLQLLDIRGKVNSTMRGENSLPHTASHLLFFSVIIS